jgi:chromosome segregation ATPase
VSTLRPQITCAVLLVALSGSFALAQVQRSGGGGAVNAQMMQQLQQAVSDRAQLQKDNSKLKKDLEDLKKQLATVQTQVTASKAGSERNQAAVVAARAATENTQKSLDATKGQMQELIARFRETVTTMRGIETDRSQLRQQLAAGQSAFDKCAEDNYSLYQINGEVLDRYAHQGAWSYFERSEPFTKIKRTQINNLVIEYRQRVEELRLKKSSASATATPGAAATAAPAAGPSPTTTSSPTATPNPSPAPGPAPKK